MSRASACRSWWWRLSVRAVAHAALLSTPIAQCLSGAPASVAFDAFTLLRRGEAVVHKPVKMAAAPAFGSTRYAIRSDIPNDIEFPVVVPPNGRLRVGFAVLPDDPRNPKPSEAEPVRFRAELLREGLEPIPLVERVVDVRGRLADRRWHDFRFDLSAFAEESAVLRLRHTFADPATKASGAQSQQVAWTRPVLYDPGAQAEKPNLLLITIDALRADHLSCYGYERPTSPRIDALASEGIRYASAFANAPMTAPSLPQLLTSRYFPHQSHPTLATQLFAGGVPRTRAIIRNVYLSLWLHFRSHDVFDSLTSAPLDADQITRAAVRWLARAKGDRFALYLHYLDVHTPYHVPAQHASRFVDSDYSGPIGLNFGDVQGARSGRYAGADRQRVIDLYDGAIHYVDAAVGELIDALEENDLLDDTLVVITADHGEELWDHGSFFHGQSLYDELLHVPLIVRLPDGASRGAVVGASVPLTDVLPTIVDVLDLPLPEGAVGASLLGPDGGPAIGGDRDVFARAANPVEPYRFGLRSTGHKLIFTVEDGSYELFDLKADPDELRNLAGAPESRPLLARLAERLDEYRVLGNLAGDFHVQAVASDGESHSIDVSVEVEGGIPLANPDRVGLGPENRVVYRKDGRLLRWTGVVEGTPAGLRFRHDHLRIVSDNDRIRFTILVDGEPLDPMAIRLGPGDPAPASPFTYSAGDPPLSTEKPPSLESSPYPVTIAIWRSPGEEHHPLPKPIMTPESREKLRSLGYVE